MTTNVEHELDFMREFAGYFKHLTTLSTGSILLIATFLEKIFKSPDWQFAVIISLTSFTVCVLASTISYTLMLFIEHPYVKAKNDLKWVGRLGVFGLIGAWGGFVFGLISFSVFTIKNLVS